jgi:hypothetical protein
LSIATFKPCGEGAAWASRAGDLADLFWRYVNRTDVWGSYLPLDRRGARTLPDGREVTYLGPITRPAVVRRGLEFLTRPLLVRHFQGSAVEHVIGLHSTSLDNTSRWGGVDIDWHGAGSTAPEINLAAALAWYTALRHYGFTPLLTDSNGRGGYHLRFLFSGPTPTPLVYAFAQHIISDYAKHGMTGAPETYPKQPRIRPGGCGNWLRLPGRHHTRPHWSKVWNGSRWLEGSAAVGFILALAGDSPALIPAEVQAPEPPAPPSRPGGLPSRACTGNLARRINRYMARLPHRREGQGRDDVAYLFAAFLVRNMGLGDEIALQWLMLWDRGNRPPKGEARLRQILASAHQYGQAAYGSGLHASRGRESHTPEDLSFSFRMEVGEE